MKNKTNSAIEKDKAPFPYFGGKSAIADVVWTALGSPKHYIEPFFGSGAVLLARPHYRPGRDVETVCDLDGFLCNVWRGLQYDPDGVAKWCDWPVNHADLSARKKRLIENEDRLLQNLIADEMWYDAKMAGYWIWAASCWIGSGLTSIGAIPNLANAGKGVHALSKRSDIGQTVNGEPFTPSIYDWFRRLQNRLRRVRVVCGDWSRVCGGDWQDKRGVVGVFFDPPYADTDRDNDVYHCDSNAVALDVEAWCLDRGNRPTYRIVACGYDSEYKSLVEAGWTTKAWSTGGGYGMTARSGEETQGQVNRHREVLFFSPHCAGGQESLGLG